LLDLSFAGFHVCHIQGSVYGVAFSKEACFDAKAASKKMSA
jgi:hypothetical protein